MSWRTVTENDLNATLATSEIESFRQSSTGGDPIADQITETVAYVRGIVRSAPANVTLGEEGTLPESLILPAMERARFGLLTRMDMPVNESRRLAYDRAEELFEKVRSGAFVVESAEDADDASRVTGTPAHGFVPPPHLLD